MKTTPPPTPGTPGDPDDKSLMRFAAVSWVSEQHRRGYPLARCFREASSRPWPDLAGQYYSARTIEDWYYDYQKGGFDALCSCPRSDRGQSRSIGADLGGWIVGELGKHPPGVPLSTLYGHWKEGGQLADPGGQGTPSLAAIYRYLRAQGIVRQPPAEARSGARKAFETGATNELWMVDFSPGPYLPDAAGAGRQSPTHLCVLIDDHSRLVPHAAYYPRANTAAFHDCLKNALRKRGLPHKLYTDNGKPFVARHSKQICARLGIQLLHARPYHSWSKGKVEKMIRSIQTGFESILRSKPGAPRDLAELNAQLGHWLAATYHQRKHRSTGQTPLSRYLGALHGGQIRPLDTGDPEELERLFYLKEQRKVRADGTIQLGGGYYEVDLDLKGLKVDVHYDPLDMARIEIYYRGSSYGQATPVDYLLNSRRRPPPPRPGGGSAGAG